MENALACLTAMIDEFDRPSSPRDLRLLVACIAVVVGAAHEGTLVRLVNTLALFAEAVIRKHDDSPSS